MIDTEKLLIDHEGDSVCGNNYEYNALMVEMRTAIQGKPEQRLGEGVIEAEEPDWKLVKKNCLELCKKTHHLEVNISLTQALMSLRGFTGLAAGSEFLAGVIERYWSCLYPQIDPADNDPIERLNQLAVFDNFVFIMSLKKVELLKSPMGSVSLYEIERSKEYKGDKDDSVPNPKNITAVFKSSNQNDIEDVYASLVDSITHFKKISSLLQQDDYVGVNQAPQFHELLKVLDSAKEAVAGYLNNSPSTIETEDAVMNNTNVDKQEVGKGQETNSAVANVAIHDVIPGIHSREAAITALEEIEDYFIKNEPSSPVPFMLQRAKGLIDKDFISLMEDLAPDGINQVEVVLGTKTND